MRKSVCIAVALLVIPWGFFLSNSYAAKETAAPLEESEASAIRNDFEDMFADVEIYRVIRKYLPEKYEDLFHAYVAANKKEDFDGFNRQLSGFVNSIRNSYLKTSSDEAILQFYRHITKTGRYLFQQDPEAAFSYIFGGDPATYSDYIDFNNELETLAEIYDHFLSTSARDNLESMDRNEAEIGMNLVYMGLYSRHGDNLKLLGTQKYNQLTEAERDALCDVYLALYEEIFALESPTRDYVLRSMAMNM